MYRAEIILSTGLPLIVRSMQAEDTAAVAAIEEAAFSQPWSEQAFLEMSAKTDTLFAVAETGKEIVGYCGILNLFGEGDITNVAVAGPMRGLGIACHMLKTVMEWGSLEGIGEYTLEVRKSNKAAIALYEKLGFKTEGIRPGFYAKPREDALIMWKRQEREGTITTKN